MNMKLLLVDDDIDDIESLTEIIFEISSTIQLSMAKNGDEMMTLLENEEQLPDFIFLDLNMPIKTGFDCLKEIRSNDSWKDIKIVILTTSSHRDQIDEVYKMGADLYIRKPNSYSAFKEILSRCLQMDWGFERNLNASENKDNPINFFDSRLVYNDIVENIALGIIVINFFQDGNFFISYTNKEFDKIAPSLSDKIANKNYNPLFEATHPDDLAKVQSSISQLFELKEFDIEFRIVDAGNTKYIRSQGRPIYNKSGKCITAYIYFNDITQLVKNQESLIVSEEKYKFLFENAPQPMLMWDFATLTILDVNKNAAALYGYTKEEFTRLNIRQIHHSEDIPLLEAATNTLERFNREQQKVWKHVKKNGELIHIEVSAQVFELNGKLVSITQHQDITEKLKTEQQLQLLDYSYRYTDSAMFFVDENGLYSDFNYATAKLFGYSYEEFKGKTVVDVNPMITKESWASRWEELRVTPNQNFDTKLKRKDGTFIDVAVSTNSIELNGKFINFGFYQDITEKKKAEAEIFHINELLKHQTNRLLLATKSAQLGIWEWDMETDTLIWDERMYQIYGISENEFSTVYDGWISRLHEEDRTEIENEIQFAINNKKDYNAEFRIVWNDSSIHYLRGTGIVEMSNGKPKRMIGVNWDVTTEKENVQYLKLLESVIINTKDSIMVTEAEPFDEPGPKILFVNQAFEEMTGYTAEEVIGLTPRILQNEETDKKELAKLRASMNKWEPCEITVSNKRKNGEKFWNNFSMAPVANEKGWFTHWIAIERDVTKEKEAAFEKERMMKELLQNNLDLKQFSYITTHNLRAPLTNLLLICKFLSLKQIDDPSTAKLIDGFKTSTNQLNETLNDLINGLIVKENKDLKVEELVVQEILDKVLQSISETIIESNAVIETDFFNAPTVHFTKMYLESVFLNLMTNAIKYRHPDRQLIVKIRTIKEQTGKTKLTFSDNGIGMDMSRVKDKIFGFYQRFHKNADSKGMGLFLVKSQINALGGQIEVESEVNLGTTFTIIIK